MHPMIVNQLIEDRRRDLLAEADARRRTPRRHHTRRVVGGWLVSAGTRLAPPAEPVPAPCTT